MDLRPPIHGDEVDEAYANPRDEVTALIPSTVKTVLDVGCSAGTMGEALSNRGIVVVGVESDPTLARLARGRVSRVIEGDVETLAASHFDPGTDFDCVVMADVLEHLRDPWSVVSWASKLLATGGCLVISVPNVRHIRLFWNLAARRRWPLQPVGLFDRTHLRWFAYQNLPGLLEGTGFAIVELIRSYRLRSLPGRLDRCASLLGDFGTLQFIFRAESIATYASPR